MTFQEYVTTRGHSLPQLARLLSRDPHQAEDIVQEVLAKAYARWRKIAATERADVYVRQMLVNASRSWWRVSRNRELPLADPGGDSPQPGADAAIVERDAVWRMVLTLPHQQRAVLVLRYYEDLDDTSISEILGVSPGTVRTHAMRGLAKLRQLDTPELSPTAGGRA